MFEFANRNLMIFFRDKSTVLLSFLAEAIIVVLYVLFIRNNLLEQFSDVNNAEVLLDVWMIAGVIGITPITTTMGAYGIMVEDRTKGIRKDFDITPLKKCSLLGGYMLAAIIIGTIMSLVMLLVAQIYMGQFHDADILVGSGGKMFGYILLVTTAAASLAVFFISFLDSSNALAACSTIVGALIGFLTGIYLPMGSLPVYVQKVVKSFPLSHGVVLFRKELMDPFLEISFQISEPAFQEEFERFMGIDFWHGEQIISEESSIVLLVTTIFVFFLLTINRMNRMRLK